MYDFSFLAPCPASGLIINGSADRVAPPKDTEGLVGKLREQKGIYMVKGGRINVAGLMAEALDYVCDSIAASLQLPPAK